MTYSRVEQKRIATLERRVEWLRKKSEERASPTDPRRAFDDAEVAAIKWVLEELKAARGAWSAEDAEETDHDEVDLGTASTRRPDPYAIGREEPQYEGHDIKLADMDAIWSVGTTPEEAIDALCLARVGKPLQHTGEALVGGDPRYSWGYRFTCDDTGFKAAGIIVPGGVILTWWK